MKASRSVHRAQQVKEGALVIHTPGCPPETLAECRRLGIAVVDATCPYVPEGSECRTQAEGAGLHHHGGRRA